MGVSVTENKHALVRVIQERADQIVPFLPPGMTTDAVAHSVNLAAIKNPQLRDAIPSSLVVAVTRGVRAGLDIGEEWHLLTFRNKDASKKMGRDVYDVVGMADYKALAQMAIASGAVRYVDPQVVREGDDFEEVLGLEKNLKHQRGAKRGAITGAYVVLRLPFGSHDFLYMPITEIDAIRRSKSKSWSEGACPEWYAKKTVIRQVLKLLPKDRRLAKVLNAIEQDELAEAEDAEVVGVQTVPSRVDMTTGEDLEYHGEQAGEDFPVEAAEDATPPKRVDADLAWAMGYVLPGNAKNWSGFGGKPLGEVTSTSGKWSILRQVLEWCDKDMAKPEAEQRTYTPELRAAAEIVLEVRLAEQATTGELPLGDASPAPRNAIADGR